MGIGGRKQFIYMRRKTVDLAVIASRYSEIRHDFLATYRIVTAEPEGDTT